MAAAISTLLDSQDCTPLYGNNSIAFLFQVLSVALQTVTFACFVMSWISVWWVAVFLSCRYAVAQGKNGNISGVSVLSPEEFDCGYYDLVVPEIGKAMTCQCMGLTYFKGKSQVRIRLGLLQVFRTLALIGLYYLL